MGSGNPYFISCENYSDSPSENKCIGPIVFDDFDKYGKKRNGVKVVWRYMKNDIDRYYCNECFKNLSLTKEEIITKCKKTSEEGNYWIKHNNVW